MRHPCLSGAIIKTLALLILCLSLMACAGMQVQLDPQSKEVLARSSARIAGALLAKEEPKIIAPGIEVCEGIVNAESINDITQLVSRASLYISADPLMLATMSDLASLINISFEDPVVTPENEALIRAAATGFKEGLQIAQAYK